jgi:hypothetical protein
MSNQKPRRTLRIIEGRKPSVLNTGAWSSISLGSCEVVGIIDSKAGLIRDLPRDRPDPEK